jgi:hypothetical protein
VKRRIFLMGVAGAAGCSRTSRPRLNVYNWSNYVAPETISNFETEFGVRVRYGTYESNEEMLAKVMTGNSGWDVVFPTHSRIGPMRENQLLAPLRHQWLSNLVNLEARFQKPPWDHKLEWSVPYMWNATGIVYSRKVSSPPAAWADLWDKRLGGRLTMLDDPEDVLGACLKKLGLSCSSTDPEHLRRAQREASADLPHDGTSGDWYFDVSKSGGYLIEQSVHNLDLCNWVIGAHPTRACGFGGILMYKNDPPGRTIFDCGSLTYDYPRGVKMSFTQSVFHPSSMPNGNQSVHVFGTKGGVDLMANTMLYPAEAGTKPYPLAAKQEEPSYAHLTAFYAAIVSGGSLPADITIGATAALTAILGHEAMTKERVMTWSVASAWSSTISGVTSSLPGSSTMKAVPPSTV